MFETPEMESHKLKKITTNLISPYFIIATLAIYFFSQFSSFNDEKQEMSTAIYDTPLQQERKLASTIFMNSAFHTLSDDKIQRYLNRSFSEKKTFSENNTETNKNK